jgi:hypothetical protein
VSRTDLPHGAWLDSEKKTVHIPLGAITITLEYEEFLEFVSNLDDIVLYFQNNAELESFMCQNCGSVSSMINFVPPGEEGDEYN